MRWLEVDSNIALPEEQVNWLRKLAYEKKACFRLNTVEEVSRAVLNVLTFKKRSKVTSSEVANS